MRRCQMSFRSLILAGMISVALDSALAGISTNALALEVDPNSSGCLAQPFPKNLTCNTTPGQGTGTVLLPGDPGNGTGSMVDGITNPLNVDNYMKQLNENGLLFPQLNPSTGQSGQ